jgi:hypothetical protein
MHVGSDVVSLILVVPTAWGSLSSKRYDSYLTATDLVRNRTRQELFLTLFCELYMLKKEPNIC